MFCFSRSVTWKLRQTRWALSQMVRCFKDFGERRSWCSTAVPWEPPSWTTITTLLPLCLPSKDSIFTYWTPLTQQNLWRWEFKKLTPESPNTPTEPWSLNSNQYEGIVSKTCCLWLKNPSWAAENSTESELKHSKSY